MRRGDVVMIYAYRGVDLVVGVMGVLGAGGAFSVVGVSGLLFCCLSSHWFPGNGEF